MQTRLTRVLLSLPHVYPAQPGSAVGSWLRAHPGAAVLLSAMAAGLAVTAVVQPVDVVTTRLWNQPGAVGHLCCCCCCCWSYRGGQLQARGLRAPSLAGTTCNSVLRAAPHVRVLYTSAAVVNGVGTLYSSAWDCAVKTVAAEGPLALYKGAQAVVTAGWERLALIAMLLCPRKGRLPAMVG